MTMPTVELHCDTCAEPSFLYRLHGTEAALCALCFSRMYASESALDRRARRVRTSGPAAAGCLRTLRTAPAVSGLHRLFGAPRR
jgi:hypothetical protein